MLEEGEDVDVEEGIDSELYEHHRIVVDKGQSLLRVDKFLLNRLENTSRNRIQNAALAGNILVNSKPAKSSYRVKPGDIISLVLAYPPRDTEIYPENIPLNIIYEDDQLLIVNKEAGMVVHPGFNNYSGTLVNALVYYFQNLPSLSGNESRPGLVHRIDKDTTGLILISKDETSLSFLARQFYDHTITRNYQALVWGDLPDEGTISGFIGRSAKDRRIMDIYQDKEKGKWSVTHYKVLERFSYCTLVACTLETGRTHQIRAHFKSLGHPLFGDTSYGGDRILKGPSFTKYKQFIENCFALMPAQALHAKTLGFVHPKTHKDVFFDSDLPENFRELLNKWRRFSGEPNLEESLNP
jgi:23S rRNA pseudouridine1911/1915/1917 synthase